MDGLGAGALRDIQNFLNVEIRLRRRRSADGICFIGLANVERRTVHV
jgi:hypothetical protein